MAKTETTQAGRAQGSYQTQCPTCGCRRVTRTATARACTVYQEWYACDACAHEYVMDYHLVGKRPAKRRDVLRAEGKARSEAAWRRP
jgi:predicted RNA-binding Zn-ribbon protein involved in translation (DUF1610 family)